MNDLQQFPPWLMPLAQWFQSQPVALGLLILMLIDVAAGLVLEEGRETIGTTPVARAFAAAAP